MKATLGRWSGLATAAVALAAPVCGPAPAPDTLLLEAVRIVDARAETPSAPMSVLIRGDRIAAVGPADTLRAERGARVIDGGGAYLAPGLWDMHTHALWGSMVDDGYLGLFVANGVTGIRDMGGELEVTRTVRRRAALSGFPAPRIVASGPALNQISLDPRVDRGVGSPVEARRAVAEHAAAGVDFIKVCLQLPPETFRAIVEEAAAHGLPVAGHVPIGVGAARAAELGLRSIEHLQAEIGGFCSPEGRGCEELFEIFRRHHTWLTPTLVVRRNRAALTDPAVSAAPTFCYAPPALRREWEATRSERLAAMSAEELAAVRERFAAELRLAEAVHAAGLPVLAGSDAGDLFSLYGFSLHDELELLVAAGLSPRQALRAATLSAAEYLGRADDLGTVEVGKLADLVLLEANPLERIGNTRRLRGVILGGELFDRCRLDDLLGRLARAVDPAVNRCCASRPQSRSG